jgi:hypothetical protein
MDWNAIIVGIGSGVVTGALSSFITLWSQWSTEKRRRRYEQRAIFIKEWEKRIDEGTTHSLEFQGLTDYLSIEREMSLDSKNELSRLFKESFELRYRMQHRDSSKVIEELWPRQEQVDGEIREKIRHELVEIKAKWKLL